MLATFGYAMRPRVHAIMDTIWPLGFVIIAAVSFGLSAGTAHGAPCPGAAAGRRVGAAAGRAHLATDDLALAVDGRLPWPGAGLRRFAEGCAASPRGAQLRRAPAAEVPGAALTS